MWWVRSCTGFINMCTCAMMNSRPLCRWWGIGARRSRVNQADPRRCEWANGCGVTGGGGRHARHIHERHGNGAVGRPHRANFTAKLSLSSTAHTRGGCLGGASSRRVTHVASDRDALAQWAHEIFFKTLPPASLSFAAIYGSAAFAQLNATPTHPPTTGDSTQSAATAAAPRASGKMLDFILATDDPAAWHAHNMELNPTHYSGLARAVGPSRIAQLADRAGGVYYNTHLQVDGRLVKYGVTSTSTLVSDLTHWDKFYLAGRLQKPVKVLQCSSAVTEALGRNLDTAVLYSVVRLLPEAFEERALFVAIAGLSYAGDPRMIVGENPHKVQNIVDAQPAEFWALYENHLRAGGVDVLNGSPRRLGRAATLPLAARSLISSDDLRSTVQRSSSAQMALGVLSAGPVKTGLYIGEKLGKWVDGLRQ